MRICCLILTLATVCGVIRAEDPKPDAPVPLKPQISNLVVQWNALMERIRTAPRPGEFRSGGTSAPIADVLGLTGEAKENLTKIEREYETKLLEKAALWEVELKSLRKEAEAKVIAALPEAKRASSIKALGVSHEQSQIASAREAKMKAMMDERGITETRSAGNFEPGGKAAMERNVTAKAEADALRMVCALLAPEDAARLQKIISQGAAAREKGSMTPKAPPQINSQTDAK